MELRHLRYFVAVADAGNVSRAAQRLHVTQPALSRQIRDLEHDFACRLFDRIGRRIILTRDGEDVLERTRRLLADAEALRERARALAGGEAGVLRIGAVPQFIEAALRTCWRDTLSPTPGSTWSWSKTEEVSFFGGYNKGSCILPSDCGAPAGCRASRSSRPVYWLSCSEDIRWQAEKRWR